jgi:hypothetical protein
MHCSEDVAVAALAATSDAMVKDTGDNRGVNKQFVVVRMTTAIIIIADEDRPRRIAG